ncbi:uncharacterized protein [Littorina saxatilis]|uniref:uncharacterized protein n=1 Tax=Littorina saxatilis TaxID=31220 RepID=UPI0038B699D1
MMTTQFRTLVGLVLLQSAMSMRPPITCETPDIVNEGAATVLTCNYNHDLRIAKQDFYVYKVQHDSTEPVIVTLCKWDDNAWSCDTDDNYKVETAAISNQVTVEIPSAKPSLSGTYFCKTLPVDTNSTHRGCNLTVKESVTCETSGTVLVGEPAHLTCDYHLDLNRRRQNFYIYRFQNDDTEPVLITVCAWDGDTVNCDVDKDYAMTTAVTRSLVTLEIQSANLIHSGKYICKTLPPDQSLPSSDCSLTVLSTNKGGTEFGWPVVPTPYIVLACVMAVLLVVASVLLIRNYSVVAQRWICACKHEPRYSILKDQSQVSHKDIFVVQAKIPFYRIETEK